MTQEINIKKKTKNEKKSKRAWEERELPNCDLWVGGLIVEHHLESVWIQLKTKKHCSKIIFKCVNDIVGPIFNEKVDKKWYLWVREQCN